MNNDELKKLGLVRVNIFSKAYFNLVIDRLKYVWLHSKYTNMETVTKRLVERNGYSVRDVFHDHFLVKILKKLEKFGEKYPGR